MQAPARPHFRFSAPRGKSKYAGAGERGGGAIAGRGESGAGQDSRERRKGVSGVISGRGEREAGRSRRRGERGGGTPGNGAREWAARPRGGASWRPESAW